MKTISRNKPKKSATSNIQKFASAKSGGTSKSSRKKTKAKKESGQNLSAGKFFSFLGGKTMLMVYGVLLMLFAVTLFISMISFYFNAGNNISYVESYADGNSAIEVSNWLKSVGAFLAYYFIKPFGVFSIGIPVLLFLYAMRIMTHALAKEPKYNLWRVTFRTLIMMFFLSFTIGIFSFQTQHSFLAGVFGNFVDKFLFDHVGMLGLVFVEIAFLAIVLFIFQDREGNSYLAKCAEGVAGAAGMAFSAVKEKRNNRHAADGDDTSKVISDFQSQKSEREDLDDLYISDHGVLSKEYAAPNDFLTPGEQQQEHAEEEIPFEIVSNNGQVEEKPSENDNPQEAEEEIVIDTHDDEAVGTLTPEEVKDLEPYDPRKDLSLFEFPPVELLMDHPYTASTKELMRKELLENKHNIEKTLLSFGIAIKSISAVVGPTVTLYEIVPKEGVRISKIKSLEDDIALSLAALGIRIIAPIPGRGTIGIEVPNKKPEIVSMRDIITSEKFKNNNFALPIGLGKTINNEAFVVDLAKMPHLLVAGATGQGKSVGLNAIITSLLYTKHPSEMKFVLVDPKKVEFTLYSTIENYYLASIPEVNDGDDNEPIITDTKKVVRTLNSLCLEMDNRYDLLKKAKMRNLKEYNAKFCKRELSPAAGHRYMPYIVVVIDEFGDLIMTAGREVEQPLSRLAQLARAIGIHLVIATQRPSVNIITGSIKANFPARIAFRVQSGVDSKTILDATGANQLIGKGDMLISTGSDVVRLQCAFVDTPEVEKIAEFIGQQSIERPLAQPYELPYVPDTSEKGEARTEEYSNPDEFDPLIVEAASLIIQTQQGSTSSIQRKMSIGYNRAGRIMDQLEDLKIVGPGSGSKPRQVLVKTEMELRQLLAEKGLL